MNETKLKTYIGVLTALALTLTASWVYWYDAMLDLRLVLGAAFFTGLLLLAGAFPIKVSERYEINSADVCLVAAIVTVGPVWTVISALPFAVFLGKRNFLRTVYVASHISIDIYLSAMVFSLVSKPLLWGNVEPTASVAYGAFASAIVLISSNSAIDAGLLKVKYNQTFKETWREQIEPYLLSHAMSILTAGLGVLTLLVYGPVAAVVVIAGSIASQVLVYRSREQVKENRELQGRVRSLEESLKISNTTFGLMIIGDLGRKDGYTDRHAAATAVYASDLAREMKLDEARADRLRMAGLLHNVGLFTLPEDLLLATGRLNSVAKSRLAEHSAGSEKALATVPEFREMASWVRWHHERPDGRGYPDKLRGPWIPLEAKVLGVAQAYAAMVLDQPRRSGMEQAAAREELISGIDTQFDGEVVRAFLRILDTDNDGYRAADDHRFLFPDPKAADRQGLASPQEPDDVTSAQGATSLRRI